MPRLTTIDLGFQGFSQIIAAYAAPTGDGRFVLFESGPASSVEAVERGVADLGFSMEDLAALGHLGDAALDHLGGIEMAQEVLVGGEVLVQSAQKRDG